MNKCLFFVLIPQMYLYEVIFTLVGRLQAEMGEVEFDPVALWHCDVPDYALVVRVRLGEARGGEATV